MALPATNNAEGGSDGTTVTTGNSGGASGVAWTTVDTSILYDDDEPNAIADGLLAYDHGAPAAANKTLGWNATVIGSVTNVYGRFYMYRTTTPAEQQRVVRFFDTAGTEAGRISWHTDAKVYSFDSSLAVPPASSFTITPGLIRFEFNIVSSTTVGVMEVKVFNGHSTTEVGTYTRTSLNTLADFAQCHFGSTVGSPTPGQFWTDAFILTTAGYPGPVSSGTPATFMPARRRGGQ